MRSTTQLRNLLKEPGMVVAPGCFDAVSGLIIKHLGFKATYVTGSGMEATMHDLFAKTPRQWGKAGIMWGSGEVLHLGGG